MNTLKKYYYSTQPFLAWLLNTCFYKNEHYTFLAPFYPYRQGNPKSSNPYFIYQDLLLPWKDNDIYDKSVMQFRLNIRTGVLIKEDDEIIPSELASELKEICDKISLKLFYPVVYRVDVENIKDKLSRTNSAFSGSNEYLVKSLNSDEFDILFFDDWSEYPVLQDLYINHSKMTQDQIISVLKENYV